MRPVVLDGRSLARQIEQKLELRVRRFANHCGGHVPTLATMLVGDDPASTVYIRMKRNACRRIGMESALVTLPRTATTEEVLAAVIRLNQDPEITGILLQHPMPAQINERMCFDAISPQKDVDGVTCSGFGRMSMGLSAYGSATPVGVMRLLEHHRISVEGKHAVVIGRSPILGKPMAMMLLAANSTVTICHSRTGNLAQIVRTADIVVGAIGKPEFIRGGWIKDDAVIIDAGYHPGGIGDIELSEAAVRSAAYTPVPGGVGPMTIAALLANTVDAAERAAVGYPSPLT